MSIQTISPQAARQLQQQGARFIDIRGADEFGREHISGATCVPGDAGVAPAKGGAAAVYYCRSGIRTAAAADQLAAASEGQPCYIIEGGLDAWKRASLPVVKDRSQPIEMQRQVQIGAGSLVLVGVVLGALVHPGFFALSGFVGAGLVFAGVSGFCGMARVLALAPWNRRAARA